MIPEFFIGLWDLVAGWFIELLPADPPPEFLVDADGLLSGLLESAAGTDAWIPWGFAITVALTVLGVWAAGIVIRLFRWFVGLIPTMGG